MSASSSKFDTVLDLCREKQRRIVLAVLAEQQRSLTTDDLVKMIVTHNHRTPLTEVSGETVARIKTALYHIHIPRLEEAGFIEYDSERQLVDPTAEFDRGEPHLSAILNADPDLATSLWAERPDGTTELDKKGE